MGYKRPKAMIALLGISTLLGVAVLCLIPLYNFDNPYILYTTGKAISRPLTAIQTWMFVSGLIVVMVMNFGMIIGYLAKRTKAISIIAAVFSVLAVLYTWVMCFGYSELRLFPNDQFMFSILTTVVCIFSICAAIVGIAKACNPEREKINQLTKELEELKKAADD